MGDDAMELKLSFLDFAVTFYTTMLNLSRKNSILLCLLAAAVMVFVEWQMGRFFFCKCGIISIWSGDIWSNQNSQQLIDPYTFTHILHGWIFYFLLWLVFRKKFKFWPMMFFAVVLECGWEILENTNWVINRYRENTISLDYYGDSIFNSFADVWAMALGFWLACKLNWKWSVACIIAIEIALLFWIHDNLTLNIIMLFYPFEAIKAWQMPSAF